MLNPSKMAKVMVVGSKDWLEPTIEKIFDLGLVHLIDFKEDEQFKIGQPMGQASELSENMIRVRNLLKTFGESESQDTLTQDQMNAYLGGGIKDLESDLVKLEEERTRIQGEISTNENLIREIDDIKNLPLEFSDYTGYKNLSVFVGKIRSLPEFDFECEIFEDKERGVVALFVPKDKEEETSRALTSFTPINVPNYEGTVKGRVESLQKTKASLESNLKSVEQRMDQIKKEHAHKLLACQEDLEIRIKKSEMPLRLATTPNSFIINGWVEDSRYDKLCLELEKLSSGGLYVENLGIDEHHDDVPIKLENPETARPFEGFLRMFSMPQYQEIDPSIILFIFYPMFFGLIIGDLMYGLGFMALSVLIKNKDIMGVDGKDPAKIIFLAGVWASIFGIFLFGEFMGIHFAAPEVPHFDEISPVGTEAAELADSHDTHDTHEADSHSQPDAHGEDDHGGGGDHGDELYWSDMLGIHFPHNIGPIPLGVYSKFHDLSTLLRISLVIGLLQINVGLLIGYINEKKHDAKKALYGKIGWMVFQVGFFTLLFSPPVASILTFIPRIFVVEISPPYIAFPIGSAVTLVSLVMLLKGEGINAVMEIPGIFSNMLSYTRLVAVGLSKAGMALAVNTIGFKMLILGGGIGNIIAGFLVLLPFHLLIFTLGIIAGGLHSLRLQYVEFFTKFYMGGGKEFDPLRVVRKFTKA